MLYIIRRIKNNRRLKMDFFRHKSDNALINDLLKVLSGETPGVTGSSLRRRSDKCPGKNNGFDPFLDDSSPEDYVFNGWGGLDDEE